MKQLKTIVLFASLMLSIQANAKVVSGVDVADTIELNNHTLQLNGAGVRSKFFMDLYVGSLYTLTPTSQTKAVLDAPIAVIRLNITSGLITSDKMHDAIIEGFEDATDDNLASIKTEVDAFMALFSDEIIKGDQFTLEATKGVGVTAYKNGQAQATIEGEAFREALLNIWLGKQPAQKNLKQAMLGK